MLILFPYFSCRLKARSGKASIFASSPGLGVDFPFALYCRICLFWFRQLRSF